MKSMSLGILLMDSTPTGPTYVHGLDWLGWWWSVSRTKLHDLIAMLEKNLPAVYILIGTDPNGKTNAYVGETDNIGKRLAAHDKDTSKDNWHKTCVCAGKGYLTKAHVKFLERQIIDDITVAGKARLSNIAMPERVYLPDRDLVTMNVFVNHMRTAFIALGHDFLWTEPVKNDVKLLKSELKFVLKSRKEPGMFAEALEVDGEFIVTAGSLAAADKTSSYNHYRPKRDSLKSEGILVPEGSMYRFTQDVSFGSPTAASSVVLDRSNNGRTTWMVQGTKKTYVDVLKELSSH